MLPPPPPPPRPAMLPTRTDLRHMCVAAEMLQKLGVTLRGAAQIADFNLHMKTVLLRSAPHPDVVAANLQIEKETDELNEKIDRIQDKIEALKTRAAAVQAKFEATSAQNASPKAAVARKQTAALQDWVRVRNRSRKAV